MNRMLLAVVVLAGAMVAGISQTSTPSYTPKDGFVPNAETAVKIAEAVLVPVYGEKVLLERPFNAVLHDGVWTVDGTLHCNPPGSQCNGGAAQVRISKATGQILHMIHYK